MRDKKLGAELAGAGGAPRGQAGGVQSGDSFISGGEGADLARDAVRDGTERHPLMVASQGQRRYRAGGIKVWSGLGRNLICWLKQNQTFMIWDVFEGW